MQIGNGGLWRKCVKISETMIGYKFKTVATIDLKFKTVCYYIEYAKLW